MIRLFAVLACFAMLYANAAASPRPPEFAKAYKAYTELIKQGKVSAAVPHAKTAFEIALKSQAFDDETRAQLAFNLGYAYFEDDQLSASAEAFTQALDLFGKAGGNTDLKADALVYRGACYRLLYKYAAAERDLTQALSLLTGKSIPIRIVRADALEGLAWIEIVKRRHQAAQQHATEAYEIVSELLTDRHPRTLRVLLAVSAAAYLRGDQRDGRDLLARAVGEAEKARLALDEPGAEDKPGQFTRRELLLFHRTVASLYKVMKRRADARYHEKIADDLRKGIPPPAMRVKPIERRPPRYPFRAERKGVMGWAIVEFTVRRDGTTTDIRLIDAAPEGYFEDAAMIAAKGWKFEPPMENGRPAEVKGVRTRIEFKFEY